MKNARIIIKTLLVLLILDIAAVAFYWSASSGYAEHSDERYDCGVVFFHGVTKTGELSEESVKRCNKAYYLFEEKHIENIICSGGLKINYPNTGSVMMKDYLVNIGINKQNIYADTVSHSSLTNWRESLKIIRERGFKKIVVISSPSHILRLKYICKEPEFYIKFAVYSPDSGIFDIFADCNVEFVKWFFLLVIPESFSDRVKDLIR